MCILTAAPETNPMLEALYERYQSMMFYKANKILNHDHDADDVVHEAFLILEENLAKISAMSSPQAKAYIMTIVENKAIDLYRKKQRWPNGTLLEEIQGMTVEHPEEVGLVQCMNQLPDRERTVLLYRHEHGYSVREMAEYMGISLAAAYKLEQRAKARLEALCKEHGIL